MLESKKPRAKIHIAEKASASQMRETLEISEAEEAWVRYARRRLAKLEEDVKRLRAERK